MNNNCQNNDYKHRFFVSVSTDEDSIIMINLADITVYTYHTCMLCGHVRAIGPFGSLYYWSQDDDAWYEIVDNKKLNEQYEINA